LSLEKQDDEKDTLVHTKQILMERNDSMRQILKYDYTHVKNTTQVKINFALFFFKETLSLQKQSVLIWIEI